jgi:hypothetical protein
MRRRIVEVSDAHMCTYISACSKHTCAHIIASPNYVPAVSTYTLLICLVCLCLCLSFSESPSRLPIADTMPPVDLTQYGIEPHPGPSFREEQMLFLTNIAQRIDGTNVIAYISSHSSTGKAAPHRPLSVARINEYARYTLVIPPSNDTDCFHLAGLARSWRELESSWRELRIFSNLINSSVRPLLRLSWALQKSAQDALDVMRFAVYFDVNDRAYSECRMKFDKAEHWWRTRPLMYTVIEVRDEPVAQARYHMYRAVYDGLHGDFDAARDSMHDVLAVGTPQWTRTAIVTRLAVNFLSEFPVKMNYDSTDETAITGGALVPVYSTDTALHTRSQFCSGSFLLPAISKGTVPSEALTYLVAKQYGIYIRLNLTFAPHHVSSDVKHVDGRTLLHTADGAHKHEEDIRLNATSHEAHREPDGESEPIALVTLMAIGFNVNKNDINKANDRLIEETSGVTARLKQLAAAFTGVTLTVHHSERLDTKESDPLQLLMMQPTRTLFLVAHGNVNGRFGPHSLAQLMAFLIQLNECCSSLRVVVIYACDLSSPLLKAVRRVAIEREAPWRFHVLAFHQRVFSNDQVSGDLLRSALSERSSRERTPIMRSHREEIDRAFSTLVLPDLARSGFIQANNVLTSLERALMLCTKDRELTPPESKRDREARAIPHTSGAPATSERIGPRLGVIASVYLTFLDEYGGFIGSLVEEEAIEAALDF